MDPNVQAVIDAMQQQQEHFMTTLKTLFNPETRSTPGSSTPRLDTLHKSKKNWAQYIERLDQHFVLHNITDLDKKRAFLLSCLDLETYKLLQNLFVELNVSEQTFAELVEKLSSHFKRAIHVQASRYSFYNCQMEANQSYAEWVATLRGIEKNCEFSCKSEACNHKSYTDEEIRDVLIQNTPHAEVRRQCLIQESSNWGCRPPVGRERAQWGSRDFKF